jgi:biotin synthase
LSRIDRAEALRWLTADEAALEELWARADRVRGENVGDAVHLRGLLEISSHCARGCAYCGLRAENRDLPRYRMTEEEIREGARKARAFGYGTVVLQAGEDPGLTEEGVSRLVRRIKEETGLAVTLSLGERSEEELAAWREAGADRYLLRFETSNRELFRRIHPPKSGEAGADRIALLRVLRRLGYEVGSGVMAGIPGQTIRDLAEDLELFRSLDLDMIGIGPFLPHPATPLGAVPVAGEEPRPGPDSPAPNSELMTYRMVALARLFCPGANIPSTTALATVNLARGRELGLQRGANVVMPNLTPPLYRSLYEIYPGKACIQETAEQCRGCLEGRLRSIGRAVGTGPGSAPAMERRTSA